ncbi:thiamine transporter 2-like isoform X2 [Melanaphis sacchari]|uniref:Thiamine transporter 1 n=3 Tax=Melanaphis sacchari TaxID=742174 RepID=A0A2H8TRF0_9HEMI|nr:thiamine transporter 2-like isoform X2 [Melanaphis sacchari]
MEKWKIITYNVAVFMFFYGLRPLDTYLTSYLTGPDGNISLSEVANTMESIRSYSSLVATIIMLAIPKHFYKSAIITFMVCAFIAYILVADFPSLTQLWLGMVGIGATSNIFILGFSYLVSQISDKQQYQKATSIVSVSLQLGVFCGSVFSQIIVSTTGIYTFLPYLNASAMLLSVISACLFPTKKKHSFRMANVPSENTRLLDNGLKNKDPCEKNIVKMELIKYNNTAVENNLKGILLNFKTSYSDIDVLKRSILYTINLGSHFQILGNMNVLYSYIVSKPDNHDFLLNGYVDAMFSLCGAVGAYIIGIMRLDWNYYGDFVVAVCSFIMGILVLSCYFYNHLYFIYLSYILYGIVSQMAFVLNFSEIAKRLKSNCFSLVYGFNVLSSVLISSLMTMFFVQINFLEITIPGRFLFIGGLEVSVGVGFFFLSYIRMIKP